MNGKQCVLALLHYSSVHSALGSQRLRNCGGGQFISVQSASVVHIKKGPSFIMIVIMHDFSYHHGSFHI